MEFLEETLFGQQRAVSANLLSLTQNINLTQSRQVLREFYEKHKDRLDASYKVTTRDAKKSRISIYGCGSIPSEAQSIAIYILAPQRASDPAILAEVSDRVRSLLLQSQIAHLKNTGIFVNPLLDPDFTVASQSHLHGPLSKTRSSNTKPQSAESIKAPARPPTHDKKLDMKSISKVPVAAEKPVMTDKQKLTEAPTKASQLSFAKANKSEALKSARRPQRLPVPQKVVLGNQSDSAESGEEDEVDSVKRETEMRNLESLYDNEKLIRGDLSEGETDNDFEENDHENGAGNSQEESDPGIIENMEPTKVTSTATVSNSSINTGTETEVPSSVETEKSNDIGALDRKRKRTRRVAKTIITKDEEGFDVRQQIYVDEDISDGDHDGTVSREAHAKNSGNLHKQLEAIKPDEEPDDGNQSLGKPNTDDTPTSNVIPRNKKAKAPPKRGNQTSLMNFFKSK